ncbi:DivIVA domain-containing protein [Glaciihabitans sp. INWT7]|uniref:DivIVA domain-containing protein n=1 Tax=Glaciihabitans sp. INWT7 TaxID=2596912 RepID=UPI00162A1A24|nr:DivIVA domain-containing protein [Glaciihabitans sp. INWT7]QNE46634.1 DivIVA domain-containing protein [Glaciihabitans sp. INWT7]
MALTPEDVVNKRFQPTKFREGYDQDEVDDFLDEVVVELRRLNQENEELRQRLVAGESRISELQRSAAQPAALTEAPQPQAPAEQGQLAQALPRFGETPVAAPIEPAPAPVPAPIAYPSPEQNAIDSGNTNNLLQLARKLHEEHVREGIEKRDALIAEGHATAARVVSEAEAAQRSQISQLDNEKAALEQQKTTIEHQIEDLRTFEREYRQKLKGYIEGQLKELDATEPAPAAPETPAPVASAPVAAAPYESVPATSGSYDLGSSDGVQSPPASFQGFGGN